MKFDRASHGPWCNARTRPTRCPHCGARVFYFACDCGCKVFFDSLGCPWPVHECGQRSCDEEAVAETEAWLRRTYARRQTRRQKSKTVFRRRSYTGNRAPRQHGRRGSEPHVTARQAELDQVVEATGIVQEGRKSVDLYDRFLIPKRSRAGIALLGPYARRDFLQVTVRVNDPGNDTGEIYIFLVDRSVWSDLGAAAGDLVTFQLIGEDIPGRGPMWVCHDIRLAPRSGG